MIVPCIGCTFLHAGFAEPELPSSLDALRLCDGWTSAVGWPETDGEPPFESPGAFDGEPAGGGTEFGLDHPGTGEVDVEDGVSFAVTRRE